VAAAALFAAASAASARAEVVWLCKPGETPDPCAESQRTTIEAEYAPSKIVNPKRPKRPPIDCFYVYPTVSEQPGINADKSIDDQEIEIARYQAARFSLKCRVFAPMYRQLTLGSIFSGSAEARAKGRKIAYGDVREAWLKYLRRYNHGRGFVLIGHSQGTGMLRLLTRERVDPKPRVRRRLVSALLLGGNVLVRKGGTRGGDFAHIPLCTGRSRPGCVVAYSTFEDDPPDNTLFGRSPDSDLSGAGFPFGPGYEVACTNPASLAANARTPLSSLLRSEPLAGILGQATTAMYGGPPPSADTPWLQPSEHYSAKCEHVNGAHVLMAEPIGSARHLNAAPSADWGLHLVDGNLPLGNLVRLVGRQSRAYRHRHG
jgi:hypothetical protein